MELFRNVTTRSGDTELWFSVGAALSLVVGAWAMLHEFSTPARLAEQRAAQASEQRLVQVPPAAGAGEGASAHGELKLKAKVKVKVTGQSPAQAMLPVPQKQSSQM